MVDQPDQLLDLNRLGGEGIRPAADRGKKVSVVLMHRQNHDRGPRVASLDRPSHIEAGHRRQADVDQHHVGGKLLGRLDRRRSIGCFGDDQKIPIRFQAHANAAAKERVIVNNKNSDPAHSSTSPDLFAAVSRWQRQPD
jgi:hypothetical protein